MDTRRKNREIIRIKNGDLFFKNFQALKKINITINKGDKVAIIGHNGAGKSTLIDIITGIKKLNSGTISYNLENGLSIKDVMGVQFQKTEFSQGLKVKHLLGFYLDVFQEKLKSPKIQKMLTDFRLNKKLNTEIRKMSGGQKQKLSIMISLLNNPKILIVDEVLTGLDITSQQSVLSTLESKIKTNKSITFITVSHSPLEISTLVNRIIVLEKGNVINDTTIKQIESEYGNLDKYLRTLVEHE